MPPFQDIRGAVRGFRREPGFAALVIVTLAAGIGGTVAMFSVADAVLLTPLPYRDADRLAIIWNRHETTGADRVQISGPDFLDYRRQTSSFEEFAYIHNATEGALNDGERAEQVSVGFVSANFFEFLGASPAAGRLFSVDEAAAAGSAMGGIGPVVISHDLWTRRYGGDPTIIGRSIRLGGTPLEVIGVLPAGFGLVLPHTATGAMTQGANETMDAWRVLPDGAFSRIDRSLAVVRVLGRLRPGVSVEQAQQEFDRLATSLRAEHGIHDQRGMTIRVVPFQQDVVSHVRPVILSLFGGVALVLVIACANVANLVSVQANRRTREIAVRIALGATRRRIVQQLFTEYALLAVAGGLVGLGLARVLIGAIVGIAPASVPLVDRIAMDGRVVGFAMGAACVTTVLFGLWPALGLVRSSTSRHLSAGDRSAVGGGNGFRGIVVAIEIALSVVLLAGSGLLVRSFLSLQQASIGFEPAEVVTAKVALGVGPYAGAEAHRAYWETLRRRLAEEPSMAAVSFVWPLPFTGQGAEVPYDTVGGDSPNWGRFVAFTASTLPGYFETMGAVLRAGRTFEERYLPRAATVVVIDDIAAARAFPDGQAVGRTLWLQDVLSGERRPAEVIGVIGHLRHSQLIGDEREVVCRLVPDARTLAVVARAAGGSASIVGALRDLTASIDPNVLLFDERTLRSYLDARVAPTEFTMTLATAFGAVALLMAAVGLYGVVSYSVARRTSELGLRMALGADAQTIVRLVVGGGAAMAVLGIAGGLAGALPAMQVLESQLVGVEARDPATFVGVTIVLFVAVLVASYLPARRAARLDPVRALRSE